MDPDLGYFDCMSECEAGINWSFKDYNAESYMFAQTTDNENILKENVLSSNRVADAIDKVWYSIQYGFILTCSIVNQC